MAMNTPGPGAGPGGRHPEGGRSQDPLRRPPDRFQQQDWWGTTTRRHDLPAPAHPGGPVLESAWAQRTSRRRAVLNVVLVIVAALVVAGVMLLISRSLGPPAFLLCGVLALVPLAICLQGLRWIDRWDPEPRGALLFAFLWGAGASVAVTLLLGTYVIDLLGAALATTSPEVIGAVLQAPVVEEFAKGLGVLILVHTRRSHFDGPVDGIVYAGTVAAGFAFTENILYFGAAVRESGDAGALVGVFILRGLFSPFAHVMFTSLLGFVLGFALSRGGGTARILSAFLLGLIPAIAGHMLWNGGTLVLFDDFFLFYLVVQVPLFIAAVVAVVLLRRSERRLTETRLGDYARAGWFTWAEVQMLATIPGRSQALAWAGSVGARQDMLGFIRTGSRIAYTRQRMLGGRRDADYAAVEVALLDRATLHRERILRLASASRR
ncbi:PrsW family intramembrane metalloprotease [Arthrobacter agilis]|uniref:PrsW family intramembrane metalloprotease n=1 Tax=Arthrobacter agilis TaxID=37921 RepID=UPI00236500D2|nr:PrsW family intramembrane metalloprotease [Arthrobacter agilis]WDF31926.1 PrsW family intramembrane metalloprotease [Arthrobacter agilis]